MAGDRLPAIFIFNDNYNNLKVKKMEILEKQIDFNGNIEHLKVLLEAIKGKDISIWNNWREKNKEVRPDLKGIDLSRETIGEICIHAINLTDSDLKGGIFKYSNFINADFSNANCANSDFFEAKFNNVNFSKAIISGSNFITAKLIESNLCDTILDDSVLMHTDLSGSKAKGVSIYRAHLVHCKINNMECEYIYYDSKRKQRFPKNRKLTIDELKKIFAMHNMITEEFIQILE
jgi:uncharacterized protein YjbI with pentapeptide repeats